MRKQKGFSLIELLIVVAIILIIAAIAIPNLIRSRIAANEASAVGSLRTINTAEATYQTSYPQTGYACSLANLAGTGSVSATSAGLIDTTLGSALKSGYSFNIATCSAVSSLNVAYSADAAPVAQGQTGNRYFCSDQSGVINFGSGNGANCTTPL